jgi:hypothetical protein
VEPRFPTLAAEKEFAQSTGRAEGTAGLTDREATHRVLSDRANRYLVRQLCFVMSIQASRPTYCARAILRTSICWSQPSALLRVPLTWTW